MRVEFTAEGFNKLMYFGERKVEIFEDGLELEMKFRIIQSEIRNDTLPNILGKLVGDLEVNEASMGFILSEWTRRMKMKRLDDDEEVVGEFEEKNEWKWEDSEPRKFLPGLWEKKLVGTYWIMSIGYPSMPGRRLCYYLLNLGFMGKTISRNGSAIRFSGGEQDIESRRRKQILRKFCNQKFDFEYMWQVRDLLKVLHKKDRDLVV